MAPWAPKIEAGFQPNPQIRVYNNEFGNLKNVAKKTQDNVKELSKKLTFPKKGNFTYKHEVHLK